MSITDLTFIVANSMFFTDFNSIVAGSITDLIFSHIPRGPLRYVIFYVILPVSEGMGSRVP